ncbi:MAG: TGS domain-containing protein [Lachnospiraceae bacterium]
MNDQQLTNKLRHIENTVQTYYEEDDLGIRNIREAFSFVQNCYKTKKTKHLILHAVSVAESLAKWRLDYSTITAGFLHDIFKNASFNKEIIIANFSSLIINELEQYLDLYAESENVEPDLDKISLSSPAPYYILIAERLDDLLSCPNSPSEVHLKLAEQTRTILIPKLTQYHAFEIINELEEACFRILNKAEFEEMHRIVDLVYDQSQVYTEKFFQSLNRIFISDYNMDNSKLNLYHPHISILYSGKRSYISLHRFIKRFGKTVQEQLALLKNTYVTAYWDFTLVVDDNLDINNSLNKEELFFAYYQEKLRAKGIRFLGYHATSYGDSTYFLISDELKNIYRFFIKTKSEYLRYLCGDIIDYCDFITDNPNSRISQKIRVYCPDGRPMYFDPGSTVLDFAFAIHKDIGLNFDYAIINNDHSHRYGIHHILNNEDQVEIIHAEETKASLFWFRHVNTDLAKDVLIKYFNTLFNKQSNKE